MPRSVMLGAALIALVAAVPAYAAPQLRAGTGRAAITPTTQLPFDNGTGDPTFTGVHDPLFARALVLEQDGVKTVLVVADVINLPDDLYDRVAARIVGAFHVGRDHVWISATHVHTVPWSLARGYERTVSDGIVAAVAEAARAPEVVTMDSGTGTAAININRDERTANGFILGKNPAGASDKTVRVVGFFRADGTPKAILANYAVHAVVLHSSVTGPGHTALVSADLPGATDAFVDARFPGAMTFWTSGAAGDQNPIMMSISAEPGSDGRERHTDLGAGGFTLVERWGQDLGLEIARVVSAMRPQPVTVPLRAGRAVVSCPAKTGGAAKSIRLSRLAIGPVNLLAVSGEVATVIDGHLRAKLGGQDLVTLTLTNGYAGYLPDDASYARGQTFEVGHSFVTAGCAEDGIVNAAAKLLAP